MIEAADITGLVLAGGRGSRMGGVDKGLQNFNGIPLALFTLMRLQPQVGEMIVNANRNLAAYEAFGVPVWPDVLADYAGPLAGFLTGLERCETDWLLTVPCDTPLFPQDLAPRHAQAAETHARCLKKYDKRKKFISGCAAGCNDSRFHARPNSPRSRIPQRQKISACLCDTEHRRHARAQRGQSSIPPAAATRPFLEIHRY